MAHTPAPWKVSSEKHADEYACVITGGEHNGIIAKAELSPYHDIDRAEANAKLISAAPELLEALEEIKSLYMISAISEYRKPFQSAWNKVESAIAKAKLELNSEFNP